MFSLIRLLLQDASPLLIALPFAFTLFFSLSYTASFSPFSNCIVYKIYTFFAYMLSHVSVLVYTYSIHGSAHARRNVIGLPPGALCKFAHARSYRRWPSIRSRARGCVRPLFHRQIPKRVSLLRSGTPQHDRKEHVAHVTRPSHSDVRSFARKISVYYGATRVSRRSDSRDFRSTYEEFEAEPSAWPIGISQRYRMVRRNWNEFLLVRPLEVHWDVGKKCLAALEFTSELPSDIAFRGVYRPKRFSETCAFTRC